MKQKQKIIDLEASLQTFDRVCKELLEKYDRIYWHKQPQEVVYELLQKAQLLDDRYAITYNDASQIMEKARSSKMGGGFNCGIDEIKQAWQKNYVGEI